MGTVLGGGEWMGWDSLDSLLALKQGWRHEENEAKRAAWEAGCGSEKCSGHNPLGLERRRLWES